jgi:hypothetical protein
MAPEILSLRISKVGRILDKEKSAYFQLPGIIPPRKPSGVEIKVSVVRPKYSVEKGVVLITMYYLDQDLKFTVKRRMLISPEETARFPDKPNAINADHGRTGVIGLRATKCKAPDPVWMWARSTIIRHH